MICAPSEDSDQPGHQADLSLRWAHMPLCWFCHEAAQLCCFQYLKTALVSFIPSVYDLNDFGCIWTPSFWCCQDMKWLFPHFLYGLSYLGLFGASIWPILCATFCYQCLFYSMKNVCSELWYTCKNNNAWYLLFQKTVCRWIHVKTW